MRSLAFLVIAGCGRIGFDASPGDAPADAYVPPDIVIQPGCGARDVGVGELHTCVLVENGAVYCTGDNMFGELGTGAVSANVDTPVLATKIVGAKSLHGGRGFTAFLDIANTTYCIGINANRQCGVGFMGAVLDPMSPLGLPATTRVATGYSVGCAVTTTGDLYCWGDGDEGQAGNGTDPGSHLPEIVPAFVGASAGISVGTTHLCGLVASGEVACWGDGLDLRLGVVGPDTCPNASTGAIECALLPQPVPVPPLKIISAGDEHTCGLTMAGGNVWCWGSNDQGQVGVARSPAEMPQQIGTLANLSTIVAGHDHTCVLDPAGTVQCWGDNVHLQLGYTGSDSITPITVPLPERATSLHQGPAAYHTCAILEGGSVWCWGRGGEGQLGRGPQSGGGLPSPMLLPCP